MTAMAPISEISLPGNNMHAFQDVKSVKKNTEAESSDAIQSKAEVQEDSDVKNNLHEDGFGENIDFYM